MSEATERLDAIEARLKAATPVPWDCDGFADGDIVHLTIFEGTNQGGVIASDITRHGDADLLFNAPADVAYLLDLARKQAAALDAVRELAERWAGLDNSPGARANRLRALRAALEQS